MFIRAYLRASTADQDASRVKDQLTAFVRSMVIVLRLTTQRTRAGAPCSVQSCSVCCLTPNLGMFSWWSKWIAYRGLQKVTGRSSER